MTFTMPNILNLYIKKNNLMLSHYFNKYIYVSSVLNITYHHDYCFLTVPKRNKIQLNSISHLNLH